MSSSNFIGFGGPAFEPTICVPVQAMKELTLVSNAYTLGWYGFAAGIMASVLFYVGWVYAAPWVIARLPEGLIEKIRGF